MAAQKDAVPADAPKFVKDVLDTDKANAHAIFKELGENAEKTA